MGRSGWVVIATGINSMVREQDLFLVFNSFGCVKHFHLNLDRRTGYVKGYALVEYQYKTEAAFAIGVLASRELLGSQVTVNWAFTRCMKNICQSTNTEGVILAYT